MNQNLIKKLSSLTHTKYRKQHGLFLAEGVHLVEELLKSNWDTKLLVITHREATSGEFEAVLKAADQRKIAVETATEKEFARISDTESPQGILAVVTLPDNDLKRLSAQKRILIADGISDPGNLGTMVRSAVAFGFSGLISTPGSADLFNPKTVRATQGALFHLAIAGHIEPNRIASEIKPSHKLYALSMHGDSDIKAIRPAARSALIVGAEISGVNRALLDISDSILRIPMTGPVESLNAAVAAAIAMYEFSVSTP